ncbi:MAG: PASTA domain-containing protein [Candidatus Zixiibacteriota bacterium]|nr:MAG: PASTA domain-containing protein [candidate division Zixibacteria bacterium]
MKRSRQEKLRLGLLFVLVCFFFAVTVARLVHLQIFLSPQYSEIVRRQSSGTVAIPASRGIVYDRNGKVVANNVSRFSLYSYPRDDTELREVARYLEKCFSLKPASAARKYGLESRRFRWIKRHLDDDLARRIASEAPGGLFLREETQREYPFGLIGKQILGFTDIDNAGRAGVELSYDSLLAGRKGWADIRRDGLRNTYRVTEKALVKPEPGQSMVLTVDWNLQEIVEEELRQGLDEFGAKSAQAVFLDCHTGQVLAAAHYDPREKDAHRPVKLRAVSDMFEPGSVLKAFTAVGVIEDSVIDFSDSIYCEEGKWRVGRRVLHDDKEHGWLRFREVMELSSNIGIAKCALMQGGERLFETLARFRLGQKTNIGLPGETGGLLRKPSRWSDYNTSALAMGHSVAVTAIQLASGFAAIANGGKLYRPGLVLGTVDARGSLASESRPEMLGQVLTRATADTLASILRGVVESGTADAANSTVVSIAGKTGTAQIPNPVTKGYYWNHYMASFAGFFPCERPLLAGVIVYEDPQPIHYGGYTAGVSFRRVAERYSLLYPDLFTAPHRMLTETSDRLQNTTEVPNLVGRELAQAQAMAAERGLKVRANSGDGTVIWQFPPPDRLSFDDDEILVMLSGEQAAENRMFNLKGLSIREVSAVLRESGVKYVVQGRGRVVSQSIRPGAIVRDGTVCRLKCRPI